MRSRTLSVQAIVLLACFSSVSAHEIDIEPRFPTTTTNVRLILTGADGCCGAEPRALMGLSIEGMILTVRSIASLGGVLSPPTPPYAFTADAGRLSAGEYSVEHIGIEATSGQETLLASAAFTVSHGVSMVSVPSRPSESESFILRITGGGTCPSLGPVQLAGNRIRTTWSSGGCLSPPGIYTLETDPSGPLARGNYVVEVLLDGSLGTVLASDLLEVLPDPTLLNDGRFEVEVTWTDFDERTGKGHLVDYPSKDSALFYFFKDSNWELMVKVLDGCAINDHYWVLLAASTNVNYQVTIRDLEGDMEWSFENALGDHSPAVSELLAFACD